MFRTGAPAERGGSYGENILGTHKPTLDEMGPHGSWAIPLGKEAPAKRPTKTIEVMDGGETPKTRRGRPRKTGRPGA